LIRESVVVARPHGVHALVAHELVTLAAGFHSSIYLRAGGQTASLRRAVDVLALGLQRGSAVDVWADGLDEGDALAAVVAALTRTSEESGEAPGRKGQS
jgi:phosphotransferase system HPr (HPr) family protein